MNSRTVARYASVSSRWCSCEASSKTASSDPGTKLRKCVWVAGGASSHSPQVKNTWTKISPNRLVRLNVPSVLVQVNSLGPHIPR